MLVHLRHLPPPPGADLRVERVGGADTGQHDGRVEADAEEHPDAVAAEDLGEPGEPGQVRRGEQPGGRVRDVDVVDAHGVHAGRGEQPRVVGDPAQVLRHLAVGEEDRGPRVAALDAALEVVPVVDHPQPVRGRVGHPQPGQSLPRLQAAQEREDPVQAGGLGAAGDNDPSRPRRLGQCRQLGEDDDLVLIGPGRGRGAAGRRPGGRGVGGARRGDQHVRLLGAGWHRERLVPG
ncbi:MAG TPA: hypothetical protein VFE59_11880 [Trebonia sp.]|nr:hypothetical protein [Trebonia sp.]